MEREVVGGRNAVLELLKADRREVMEIIISRSSKEDRRLRAILQLARRRGVRVSARDAGELNRIAPHLNHQGVLALVSPIKYHTLEELLDLALGSQSKPLIAVLDHIQDPHNLGAIIRTAEAAGAHGVVIPKRRAAGVTPAVAKASSGAVEYIPIALVPNIAQAVERLKESGIWTVALSPDGEVSIYDVDMTEPVAIVVGSEGEGVSRLVAERCDLRASIPMLGRINSLNASVAAAIALYEAVRQRRRSP